MTQAMWIDRWGSRARQTAAVCVCAGLVTLAACASRVVVPPVGVTPRYPDYVKPTVPQGLGARETVDWHERGWLLLQAGDTRNAERAFSRALRLTPSFYPADTGLGYVRLANRAFAEALADFDRVLLRAKGYVPALVGRGDALLGASQAAEALAWFQAALAGDPSLAEVRRRVEVLDLRLQQDTLSAARRAAEAGKHDEARRGYERAIAQSPESGFLYRELAGVERLQGNSHLALQHLRKAVGLDPADARAWNQIGEILEGQGDAGGAVAAYTRVAQLEPGAAASEPLERARSMAALAQLPPEYRAIAGAAQVTRADLAALLGVRLDRVLERAPRRQTAVMTDIRGHWAAFWILTVTQAGVMEAFSNHTFQPAGVVRRADLALAASRVLQLLGAERAQNYREWQAGRPAITDMPAGNMNYAAAAFVVTAGVMPLADGGAFRPAHPVSGADALEVVGRLEVLSR